MIAPNGHNHVSHTGKFREYEIALKDMKRGYLSLKLIVGIAAVGFSVAVFFGGFVRSAKFDELAKKVEKVVETSGRTDERVTGIETVVNKLLDVAMSDRDERRRKP